MSKDTCPLEVTSNSEKIGMSKDTCPLEVMSNSEKIIALASCYHLKASVSQSVTQHFLKFHSNLLNTFWANLKACLGLVLPNQYCLIVIRAGS